MTRRDIPNLISLARIGLVVPIVLNLLHAQFTAAAALILLAGVSDAVDGWLAKRNGWVTWLGGILDPLADKALLIGCYATLGWLELLPWWLPCLIIARDAIIVVGALTYHYWIGRVSGTPTWLSKLNTVLQLVQLFAVVYRYGVHPLPQDFLDLLIAVVTATTAASGLHYIWTWGWRTWEARRSR